MRPSSGTTGPAVGGVPGRVFGVLTPAVTDLPASTEPTVPPDAQPATPPDGAQGDDPDGIIILALICRPTPRCPDPDPALTWPDAHPHTE